MVANTGESGRFGLSQSSAGQRLCCQQKYPVTSHRTSLPPVQGHGESPLK